VKTIAVVLTLAIFPESLYESHVKSQANGAPLRVICRWVFRIGAA
jgi:hypothetical protein